MTSGENNFVRGLAAAIPELRSVLDEHENDNDGLLPHVFMGDVARYVTRLQESLTDPESEASLTALLAYLEDGLENGGGDVKDMIAVSFLENLDPKAAAWTGLRQRMGFGLRRGLDRIHGA